MNILILGGTRFLGRHLVEAALGAGHTVTLFHRGKTGEELFPEVEHRHGDRDGGLDALAGGRWDAVVDTSGYVPRVVRASAERLAPVAGLYAFVSTISVYAGTSATGLDESAPVATIPDPAVEQVTGETYGPLKALCEDVVREVFAGRSLVVRPGLIVGPHDPTGRFTYWPRRLAEGGDVRAPGPRGAPVQVVDARDLAAWIVRMLEGGGTGVFNATGPAGRLSMEGMLEACRRAVAPAARLEWVGAEYLLEAKVAPWSDLPVWIPDEASGVLAADCRRAIGRGLTFRPLEETIRDTLAWDATLPADSTRAGITREREQELLAGWRAR